MEVSESIIRSLAQASIPLKSTSSPFIDILIIIVLIFINAFFSASEIAVISLNDNVVRRQAEEGDRLARRLIRLIDNPSGFLATIQVGVTLAGFLSSAFAADKFASRLYALLDPAGNFPSIYTVSVVAVTLILAFFSLTLGELVPKRIAQSNPEKMARSIAGIIVGVGAVLRPFILLLTFTTNLVLKLVGIDPKKNERSVTEEEIRIMVDVGRESGAIHAAEKEMIENIFELNDKEVSEIMTHRTNIVSLDVDADFNEVLEVAIQEKYTRIPVYEENIDNIIGILHIKDLLLIATEEQKRPFSLRDILRPATFVPESKQVDSLFREMQRDHAQMAVVIDEYGGTAGIVSLEDIIEEIVGNLQDEYDEEEAEIERRDETTFVVDGQTALDDVAAAVGVNMPEDDYDTLAGLVVGLLDRIPDEGEQPEIAYHNLIFKVLEMDDRRVSKIQITVRPENPEDSGESDDSHD
ncbi:MAG TPA: hemolysin family protein [Clostridia bacterium]